MHPRCLEEAMRIASLQRFTILIKYYYAMRSLGKLLHIIAQTNYETWQCRNISRTEKLGFLICSRSKIDTLFLKLFWSLIPLKLSTPKATEVNIDLAIIIFKYAWVDTHRATNRLSLWYKRTFWRIADSYTKMEHAIIVLSRENKIVLTILLYTVIIPHLLFSPGYLLYIENHTMIGYITILDISH